MDEECTAGLVVVGDEILRGQVVDTNTSYLAVRLKDIGVKLRRVVIVPDIVDEIAEEVLEASKRYAIVFTSGGVGPTHDDVTYMAVAKGLDLKLEEQEELVRLMASLYPNDPEARRLATVPSPCELIRASTSGGCGNPNTYPVLKTKNVYVLPGSPRYFKQGVDVVIPQIRGCSPPHSKYIDLAIKEFSIVQVLDQLAARWHGNVAIGSYPQHGPDIVTRITFEGTEIAVAEAKRELLDSLPPACRVLNDAFTNEEAQIVFNSSVEQAHIKEALNILNECFDKYKSDEVFLCFNGGKDCTVVLHLTATVMKLRGLSSLICLYITGDTFPEVDAFVDRAARYYNLEMVRKQRPIKSALEELSSERPGIKASLIGTRKGDPGSKNLEPFTPTDSGWPPMIRVSPILHWSYSQIWQFLLKHKVRYCSLYDQGYTSLGARATTKPNPLLKDPNDPLTYLPAYTLADESTERQGRG